MRTLTREVRRVKKTFFRAKFILLRDNEAVSATEFNRWLDEISPDVTVVLVMVQCYAGGFTHAIYHRHDPELGLAPHNRCGFFAQDKARTWH